MAWHPRTQRGHRPVLCGETLPGLQCRSASVAEAGTKSLIQSRLEMRKDDRSSITAAMRVDPEPGPRPLPTV